MAILMVLLIFQTNSFLIFFNQYINENMIVIGQNLISEFFMPFSYGYIILILIMDAVIWILMEFKQKKRLFYVFNFIGYALLLAFYIYIRTVFLSMSEQIIDMRIVMTLRDLTIICFTFQTFVTFITFTRAIGLNIKQFDFENDFKELNVLEEDREEFELNIEFDSNKVKRSFKATLRNFKYYFIENLRIIILILLLLLTLIIFFIYQNFWGQKTQFIEGQYVNFTDYSLKVIDSFITSNDYKLNSLEDNKSLVILKVSIKTTNKTQIFSVGKFSLQIGKNKYYHTLEYTDAIKDIGTPYVKQTLTSNYSDYLLVYEIPRTLINEKMKLVYVNEISSNVLRSNKETIINLEPDNLDLKVSEIKINLKEEVVFDDEILHGMTFSLNEINLGTIFKINYRLCINLEECYAFYEPLQASYYGSYDKSLLMINLDFANPQSHIKEKADFIINHGQLKYQIDGVSKIFKIQKYIMPSKVKTENSYFEIPKEVLNAEKIEFKLIFRNKIYIYQIA